MIYFSYRLVDHTQSDSSMSLHHSVSSCESNRTFSQCIGLYYIYLFLNSKTKDDLPDCPAPGSLRNTRSPLSPANNNISKPLTRVPQNILYVLKLKWRQNGNDWITIMTPDAVRIKQAFNRLNLITSWRIQESNYQQNLWNRFGVINVYKFVVCNRFLFHIMNLVTVFTMRGAYHVHAQWHTEGRVKGVRTHWYSSSYQ